MSQEQVEGLLQQMASLYRRCGYNMRPVYYMRFYLAVQTGMRDAATDWLSKSQAEPRDDMADCEACESDILTEYYLLMNEPAKALANARPNLDGLRQCVEVPHRVLSYVLRPLAVQNRYEEADNCQRRGYQLIRKNRKFLRNVALHMTYLAHRGRIEPAVRMLERHLSWALTGYDLYSRYYFHLGVARVLAYLANHKATQKLKLPREFPAYEPSEKYDVATLIQWFDTERTALAPVLIVVTAPNSSRGNSSNAWRIEGTGSR